MSYTGYENFTLTELERMARADSNMLAVEVCERLGEKKRRIEIKDKSTNYTDGSRWSAGQFLRPRVAE